MNYFRYLFDILIYDMDRQSVVDKMAMEIYLEVGEKSGNLFSNVWWKP